MKGLIVITQLILDDHQEQRRLFGILEQIERTNTSALLAIWNRLATFLEVPAKAEGVVFYPALLREGQGVGDTTEPKDETLDAIKDRNEIRDAVAMLRNFRPVQMHGIKLSLTPTRRTAIIWPNRSARE